MKTSVVSVDGAKLREIELPAVFSEQVRQDLIIRAVLHEASKEFQPKGVHKLAGMQTTAEYRGRKEQYRSTKNKGISRLPREKLPKGRFGRVRMIPFAVGGRRAHPPVVMKVLVEEMNRKEYAKALRSAIAATADCECVKTRGHRVDIALPLVVEAKFEMIAKTKDVEAVLQKIGLSRDLARARDGTKARSGVLTLRKGGKKVPKSVLIVVADGKPLGKAARNIPGVDVCTVKKLEARKLAPGGHPGRLTVWCESAMKELSAM